MPELPEVETIKTAVERAIGQADILQITIRNPNLREKIPADLPKLFIGAKITAYFRRAKYKVIETDRNLSLIWHLGMSGRVHICASLPESLAKHDHVIIQTSAGYLIYNDARRFGMFTYCPSDEVSSHRFFAKMGPEPLEDAFNATYLYARLQQKRIPVKVALLDQEIVVGIGNIYTSEALFGAGISPLRIANTLSLEECQKLVTACRNTLEKAIEAGGSTLKDYEKPDGSLGYFQNLHCVYNKTGQKCPKCTCDISKTGGIQKVVLAGRSTFYCPQKQK